MPGGVKHEPTEMMADGLTVRQREVLDWIIAYIDREGISPAFKEIMAGMDIRSQNGVASHVNVLRKKGFIRWREKLSRSISIVSPEACPCSRCGGTGREPQPKESP